MPDSPSRNIARPKILIVSPSIPQPDVAAGDARFFAMLQVLAKKNSIDFLILDDHRSQGIAEYKQKLQEISVKVLRHGKLGLDQAVVSCFYDIVLFEFWHCAAKCMDIIRRQQPQAKLVIDSVDMHFLREEAGLAFGISEASVVRLKKQQEIKTYQQADLIVVVTQEEQEALASEKVLTASLLVPMIVPIRMRKTKKRNQELLFVGGFKHSPNADGLLWFVNECWPSVRSHVPEVKLTIVGSHAPKEILDLGSLTNIKVAGFVPDTEPYLDEAALSIAPLRFGAGMKGKVTEAMAAGIPVITTAFGVQGLNAVSGKHLMVGNDAGVFSENIIALLSNPKLAEEIGLAGQNHIRKICSIEVVEEQLNAMVDSLMLNRVSGKIPYPVVVSFGYRVAFVSKVILMSLKQLVKRPYKLIKKAFNTKRISRQAT